MLHTTMLPHLVLQTVAPHVVNVHKCPLNLLQLLNLHMQHAALC